MGVLIGEFEDQDWFPSRLRDYQTDFLGKISTVLNLYEAFPEVLREFSGVTKIADLASGSGEAMISASKEFRSAGGEIQLTDKFPNLGAAIETANKKGVTYSLESFDMAGEKLPDAELYTMFNSLHHFKKSEIKFFLRKMSAQKKKVIIAEPLQPNLESFIKVFLATTLGCLVLTPFIKPLKLDRLIITYLLPIGLFVTLWDGLASVVKAYRQQELDELRQELSSEGMALELNRKQSPTTKVTYLILK
jgi:hypothetical protein